MGLKPASHQTTASKGAVLTGKGYRLDRSAGYVEEDGDVAVDV